MPVEFAYSVPVSFSEDWETIIDTNIKGLLTMTRFIVPGMVERNRGHIINIGSVAGDAAYAGGNVYCATKAAVNVLTDGLRIDVAVPQSA